MVFIESTIWGSAYKDLVDLSRRPDLALSVIVVGPAPDIELYVAAIERGAFSFVAPPFAYDGLNVIVHSAAMDARDRRESMEGAVVDTCRESALSLPTQQKIVASKCNDFRGGLRPPSSAPRAQPNQSGT